MTESKRLCEVEGLVEVSPFDDPHCDLGQGTIGLEMLEARPDLETLLVPLSGGGLAAGVAVAAKAIKPAISVIGISMDRGAAMAQSIRAGHPVEVPEFASLADSLGGGIGLHNRLSFPLCRDLLDDTVLVTEEEIRHAMQVMFFEDRIAAEGASVVGQAAVLAGKLPKVRGPVGTIVTGRNLDMATFTKIMIGEDVHIGDLLVKGQAMAHDIQIVTEAQLRGVVALDRCVVDVVEQAFLALAKEGVVMPPILSMDLPQANGEVDVKPPYSRI